MTLVRATLATVPLLLAACATTGQDTGPTADLDVDFAGADSQFAFRLRRQIEDLLLDFARDPADEAALFDAAQDLQDHYLALGFPEAAVEYTVQRAPRLRVVFHVHEGPRVTVSTVELAGNDSIPTEELLPLWPRMRSGLFATGDPYFVADELAAFAVALARRYEQRGYLDAKIDGPHVERAPGADRARVRFTIDEGARYTIAGGDIVPGLPLLAAPLGLAQMSGRPYDGDELQALRQRARAQLERDGYPSPRLELRVERDHGAKTVRLHLGGDSGPRARVVAISIAGNVRTRRGVLADTIRFAPGEWYDGSKVEATTRAAYLTGLFRRVEVERRPRNAEGTELELALVVEEIEAREVDLMAGYGSYESLRGGIAFTDRNLFGYGHRATLGARASLKSTGVTASWTVPNALGSGTSLTTGGYLRQRAEPTFDDRSRGLDVALARDLVGPLRGRLGYALQSRDATTDDPTVRLGAPDDYEIASIFGELLIDERDSPLYPARGHRESVKFERARQFLGGDIELDRLTWSVAGYVPLAEDLVVSAVIRGGIAWSDELLPVQERFFNGGEASVRSFEEAELGPRSVSGTPLGGAFFNVLSVEVRFPLVRSLHGALFTDVGNVGRVAEAFGASDLRYGLGGGLRLVLPIGPIRLDGGVNPDRRPGEETWVLHLSVGLPF